jgi:hypothetical protein
MVKVIWKFELVPLKTELRVPVGAEVLCIGTQDRIPGESGVFLWALCDPDAPVETRVFRTFPTGRNFKSDNLVYVGTAVGVNGTLVFHVFEEQLGP